MLGFVAPDYFDSKYSKVIDSTSVKIEKILRGITPKTPKTKKVKGENSEDYSQYLVMEIMNRAMTNIMENSGKKESIKSV